MLFCTIFYIAFLLLVNAMHNVTVDDDDLSIIYLGGWGTYPDMRAAGGKYHLTIDSNANASFTFTGVAIYFYSALWAGSVTTLVTLDGLSPVLIDLRDPTPPNYPYSSESVKSSVVWSQTGLANTTHTLLVSVGPNKTSAILDTLVYTVLDLNDISSSSTSSTSSLPSSTPSPNPSTATVKRNLAISISVVGTSIAVLIFLLWRFCKRRKGGNGENMPVNQITPQFHTVPTIVEKGTNVNDNLYEPPTTVSGLPSTLYTNETTSTSISGLGIPANTAMAEPEVELSSTSKPGLGSREEIVSVHGSG